MVKKFLMIEIKWGLITAGVLALLELVKYYTRIIDYPFQTISVLLFIVVMVGLLYLCIKEVRDRMYGGQISFARAFCSGAVMMLSASLALFPYLIVQYTYIDKEAISDMNRRNWEIFRAAQSKDTLSAEEQAVFFEQLTVWKDGLVKEIHEGQPSPELQKSVDSLLSELLQVTKHKLQGIDSLKLANFTAMAQKEWMNTATAMLNGIAQWEDADLYTQSLRTSVQALCDSMSHFALIDCRMEHIKNSVPYYKTPVAAALRYAIFTVLLYGLFFTIFVALYLHRKKTEKQKT
jgi:hypothetical protein